MNRLLVVLLSMALLAFGIFHVLRDSDATPPGVAASMRPSAADVAIASSTTKAPAAPATGVPSASADAGTASAPAPAWLLPAPRAAASNPAEGPTTATTAQQKIVRLQAVLEKLNRLQAQPTIDARAAAAAIAELEQINGSAVMNGVRLDVLRENVEVADRIQTTATELQRLQQTSATPSPEQTALVRSKTAELLALQSRIRQDFMHSPAQTGSRP